MTEREYATWLDSDFALFTSCKVDIMLFVREQDKILIINVGQRGCTPQCFQNALYHYLFILNNLRISITLE